MKLAISAALAAMTATPTAAQVFDMGTLTGTLSQDAVTQSEERRAGRQRDTDRSAMALRTRDNCRRKLPRFRKSYGSDHPDVIQLAALCRRAGY
ncbi:hypothetical protein [Sphingomonas corticis]|uniref:UrcA family protein n=1 Tax=Sphingomonas corticis TaxID=2722791 RepID=A0ABX1CXH6_9SPHN|nr:hypothetical protein [Sphingomonas corticis]NJR80702.1 hypothetical protein [Sphingomonas corticis]